MKKKGMAMCLAVVMLWNGGCAWSDTSQVVIRFSWWGGDARHRATMDAVAQFMAENPDIRVECQYGAWAGWEDATATALYAGTEADVLQVNWNWLTAFSSDEADFLDLHTVADKVDFSAYAPEMLSLCTVDGALRCVPVSLTGRVFFWNAESFAAAGLSVPDSFSALCAAGPQFAQTLGADYYPLALGWYDRMLFLVYLLESMYGRDWVAEGQLQYTQAQLAEGLACIQMLEDTHVIPPLKAITGDGADSFDKDENWMTGRYAGIYEWDSSAGKFQDALASREALVVGDYFMDIGAYQGGFSKISLGFAISGRTKQADACARLIAYLVSAEDAVKTLGTERGVPLNQTAYSICSQAGLLGDTSADANSRMAQWVQFSLDPRFECTALRGINGVYEDVFTGLSYGDYSVAQAAERLYVGITTALVGV